MTRRCTACRPRLALPDADRAVAPAFEHHAGLPAAGLGGFEITVFAGSLAGVRSPAIVFPLVTGAELRAARPARGRLAWTRPTST